MSRTDRTRPLSVRATDQHGFLEPWHVCAPHGQGTGECTLPPRPRRGRAWPQVRDATMCRWTPTFKFWRSPDGGACRCSLCMSEDWSPSPSDVERRAARRAARDAEREYFNGLHDDLSDVPDLWPPVD